MVEFRVSIYCLRATPAIYDFYSIAWLDGSPRAYVTKNKTEVRLGSATDRMRLDDKRNIEYSNNLTLEYTYSGEKNPTNVLNFQCSKLSGEKNIRMYSEFNAK